MKRFGKSIAIQFIIIFLVFGLAYAEKEWTVMVYMGADNNLESAAIWDINEMEIVGSTADINVVVQIDRHPDPDVLNGGWETTRRYYITKDSDIETFDINSLMVSDLGELNMGDPQTLNDFILWAMTDYPAQKYFLIIWDHGDGWRKKSTAFTGLRMTEITDSSRNARIDNSELHCDPTYFPNMSIPRNPFGEGEFKALCSDETNGDMLFNNEIQTVLSDFPKLDILGFDACLMGMIEVAYEFKDQASYMIASEELEPGYGWPYDLFLDDLSLEPEMSSAKLCSTVVNNYAKYDIPEYDNQTLSAVDLTSINQTIIDLNIFCTELIDNGIWSEIANYFPTAECFDEGKQSFYDLYDIADLASANLTGQSIKDAANDLKASLNNAIISNWHEDEHPNAHGLSIYFPQTPESYNIDYGYADIEFPSETNWLSFLQYFWGHGVQVFDLPEPNDYPSQAGLPLNPQIEYESYISSLSDEDWWLINSGISEVIEINLSVPPNADFDMVLLDENWTNVLASSGNAGNGTDEHILYNSAASEYMYLCIVPDNSFSNQPYYLSVAQTGYDKGGFHLSYDDGSPDGGYYSSTAGDAIGIVYNLPAYPMKVERVWINFLSLDGAGTGGDGSFYLLLYDHYGPVIDPVELGRLYPSETGWNYLDLSTKDIRLNTDFFLGLLYDGVNTPVIGYDDYYRGKDYYYDSNADEWSFLNKALFIRLDVSYPDMVTSVEYFETINLPCEFSLLQNYPNPFNPATNISFNLPRTSFVNLNVYNLLGQKIETLISREMEAGSYNVNWDGKDIASGIYFYRIETDDFEETKKMLLLK